MRIFRIPTLTRRNPGFCLLTRVPSGLGPIHLSIVLGRPVKAEYPPDARAFMEKGKGGAQAPSLVSNSKALLIVSAPIAEAVADLDGDSIEIHPLALHDQKRRLVPQPYYVLNPLAHLDCLDWDRSRVKLLDGDRAKVVSIKHRVFDRDKLKEAPPLFRLKQETGAYFATEALVRRLQGRNLTNLYADEVEVSP